MRPTVFKVVVALLLFAGAAQATTFVVPDDDELIAKSRAIVIGTVEGSTVQETDGTIETVYEIRLERALKGLFRGPELVRVVSLGGMIGDRVLYVPASPHFNQGDRVLLFLTRDRLDRWQTTDMTLGKFRFATSTKGDRMLVRDMEDVIGWDRNGQTHHEKVRREQGFLRFIDERIHKREAAVDYIVEASEVTFPPEERRIEVNAPFAAATYTSWVSNQPTRWANMAAGVTFHKKADQNISGTADGGVSVIQNGLAAWTNECGSVINLNYGGTTNTPSTNFDTIHVVEFNDPQNRISGSWTGSGTIGICFLSFASQHQFSGQAWWSITDADVVFQNGYPGNHGAFATAMTHELGHGLGWRHSNQDYATGGSCNSATQECTSAAIMNSTVNSNYGYTLQTWDVNAAQSVYPGGSCTPVCTAPLITAHPQSQSTTSGTSRTLSVTATGTGPFTYQWYIGLSGNTGSPISGANGSTLTVTPSSTTSYWVRVSNSCGSANSNTATVTVTPPPPPPPPARRTRGDYNGDGRTDHTVFRPTTGQWLIRNVGTIQWGQNGDQPVPGDYDGDRLTDVAVFRPSNGTWYIRYSSLPSGGMGWGQSGDIAVPDDYDGDGRTDIAVFRPSQSTWYIRFATGASSTIAWGASGDRPVPADFNGDRAAELTVFRPSTGQWLIRNIGTVQWGQNGDIPVPADYTGDGIEEIAIFRPSDGFWHIRGLGLSERWGQNGDQPVPGDFNGEGIVEIAIFRPSTGYWHNRTPDPPALQWGQAGDIALTE